jgi:hypothetical protein
MEKVNKKGLAIVLAWPHTTARGDELWYELLKKTGLVKNLNFRVGHAAMILVDSEEGHLHYYDFGRYITPRGHGRARSAISDPKLTLTNKARLQDEATIENLFDIAHELDSIKDATHGIGPIYMSVSEPLNFMASKQRADNWVQRCSNPYGALAPGNNNCSRYVWEVISAGLSKRKLGHRFHETLYPSPISNVVNAHGSRKVFVYHEGNWDETTMTRTRSLLFFVNQLSINFSRKKATSLPDDKIMGSFSEPKRPVDLPENATWLGGLAEGAWYTLEILDVHTVSIQRYLSNGILEFDNQYQSMMPLDHNGGYSVHYDTHYHLATLKRGSEILRLYPKFDL